jgi:MYND finger
MASSEDDEGFMYCDEHHREICHECGVDHRVTNALTRGEDFDKAWSENWITGTAERDAIIQAHIAGGGGNHMEFAGKETQDLHDKVAAAPPSGRCAHCLREAAAKKCSRCKTVRYCSKECQTAAWKAHKKECKAPAADGAAAGASASSSSGKVITWDSLEQLGGGTAVGRVLELRVMNEPFFVRHTFNGKDKSGKVLMVAFYLDAGTSPPAGLKQGAVMRWKNPHIHYFMDGQTGARIEDEDLPNITVSAQ